MGSNPQTMYHLVVLCSIIGGSFCLSVESVKAASPLTNCGCQCSSLTFRDSSGVVQGNCNTVDSTGAQWCYVESYSTCQDLVPSQRFPHNPWSYEACATPALGSELCPVVADHVHTPVVVVADHDHDHHVPVLVPAHHVHPVGEHNTEIPQGDAAPIPKVIKVEAPTK